MYFDITCDQIHGRDQYIYCEDDYNIIHRKLSDYKTRTLISWNSLTNSLISLISNRPCLDVAVVVPDGEVRVECLELGRINANSKWLPWKIPSFLAFMSSVERFCEIGIKSQIFAEFKICGSWIAAHSQRQTLLPAPAVSRFSFTRYTFARRAHTPAIRDIYTPLGGLCSSANRADKGASLIPTASALSASERTCVCSTVSGYEGQNVYKAKGGMCKVGGRQIGVRLRRDAHHPRSFGRTANNTDTDGSLDRRVIASGMSRYKTPYGTACRKEGSSKDPPVNVTMERPYLPTLKTGRIVSYVFQVSVEYAEPRKIPDA
ncbi:hypothetical protein V1478_016561 [Vespula squamosa]|uniref:Uncharacterized protein n=1 Tax=Vespula squamosa TaxID=30214 RepID=A0ABD2A048_VESSQ